MSDKPFTYLLRVRYSECDAQKVVFNAKYAEYIDLAATEFLKAVWGSYNQLNDQGIDFQVVHMEMDWLASAHFDDVLAIEVLTEKIGNTSYTLNYSIHMLDDANETVVQTTKARVVYVMVDPVSLSKKAVPEGMRADLLDGAKGQCVNHAGVEIS